MKKRHRKGNPIYKSWHGMHTRCYSISNPCYHYYGGRGIKVCQRWHDFDLFCDDMESSFSNGLTIDRIDNNGDYTPENCRWSTRKTQAQNRRSSVILTNPETMESKTVTEWSEILNISQKTITSRIRLGYTDFFKLTAKKLPRWNEQIIEDPKTGKKNNISNWCKELNIPCDRIFKRIESGETKFDRIFYQGDLRSLENFGRDFAEEAREVQN